MLSAAMLIVIKLSVMSPSRTNFFFKKLSEGETINSESSKNHKTFYFLNLTMKEISWPVFLDKLG
jgi:hypothetical protein